MTFCFYSIYTHLINVFGVYCVYKMCILSYENKFMKNIYTVITTKLQWSINHVPLISIHVCGPILHSSYASWKWTSKTSLRACVQAALTGSNWQGLIVTSFEGSFHFGKRKMSAGARSWLQKGLGFITTTFFAGYSVITNEAWDNVLPRWSFNWRQLLISLGWPVASIFLIISRRRHH